MGATTHSEQRLHGDTQHNVKVVQSATFLAVMLSVVILNVVAPRNVQAPGDEIVIRMKLKRAPLGQVHLRHCYTSSNGLEGDAEVAAAAVWLFLFLFIALLSIMRVMCLPRMLCGKPSSEMISVPALCCRCHKTFLFVK